MSVPIDERILDLMEAALAAHGSALGYGYNYGANYGGGGAGGGSLNVFRPPVTRYDIMPANCPAVILRVVDKQPSWHIRGAEKMLMDVLVICVVSCPGSEANEALSDLISEVKECFEINRKWNDGTTDLAEWTKIMDDGRHETEVQEATVSGRVRARVKFYSDLLNPLEKKVI